MRGLYQRGAIWWYRFSFQGRRYFVSTGQSDEARAILVARKIKEEPTLVATDTLRAEIYEYLQRLRNQEARPNYVNNLRDRLLDWAKAFEGWELAKISRADIQHWFDAKRGKVLPNTAVAYLDDVRRFFKWALNAKKIRTNPCERIVEPKVKPRHRARWISASAARALLDGCQDLELKYCLFCALHCGMRKDEVIMSRPEWFDFERGMVRIPAQEEGWQPKDGTARSVPLSAKFECFLVFCYPLRWPFMIAPKVTKGRSRYRFDFGRRFRRYVGGELSFHDLRRSYASILVSAGVSGYQVAKWLGDDMRQLQEVYGHLEPNREEINRVLL
jgi:integrase